jgi:diguanylate cyclase (GGDEF)-like protein/PAS domain S-box-containing protein
VPEPNPIPDFSVAEMLATTDVLRRVAGTAGVHIYEMEYLPDGSYICNAFIGAGVEALVGPLPPGANEEEAWEAAVHPDDRERYDAFNDRLIAGHAADVEVRLVGTDGVTRWVWDRGHPRHTPDGRLLVEGVVTDITARHAAEEALAEAQSKVSHLAYHDALTDLPNRLLFQEHLDVALATADRTRGAVAVLFVDLDDFKLVNDSLGHAAGDELLCSVATRILGATRASDVVARLGGDEFLVLMPGTPGRTPEQVRLDADTVAENIRFAVGPPFEVAGSEVFARASVGAAVYPLDADDSEGLLRHADISMYRAKQFARGGGPTHLEERSGSADQLSATARLRRALANRELVLHYQPLVDLETGVTVGVEALIRWNDSERGMIPPAEFIPIAERTGLIGSISEWVVEEAARQAAVWRDEGLDLYVSVNMPPSLWQETAMHHLFQTMEACGLAPDRLMIEITESAVMEGGKRVEPILAKLRERGLRLAIDDFGTGHSSLSRLSAMPVTTLKIDRSFVRDVPDSRRASDLVAAIVQLAGNLGLQPLAEGIETEAQVEFLLAQECRLGQGYLFSRPVPAAEIPALVRGPAWRRAA